MLFDDGPPPTGGEAPGATAGDHIWTTSVRFQTPMANQPFEFTVIKSSNAGSDGESIWAYPANGSFTITAGEAGLVVVDGGRVDAFGDVIPSGVSISVGAVTIAGQAAAGAEIFAGATVDITLSNVSVTLPSCPNCVAQVMVGLDVPRNTGGLQCPREVTGSFQGDVSTTLLAPQAPGTYNLFYALSFSADCGAALAAFNGERAFLTEGTPAGSIVATTGPVTFELKTSGNCLDVVQSSPDDGAEVISYQCTNNDNQLFIRVNEGVGGARYRAIHSAKCLQIEGGPTADQDGAGLIQGDCEGGANQFFQLHARQTAYLLRPIQADKCLEIASDGGISQQTCREPGDAAIASQLFDLIGRESPVSTVAIGDCQGGGIVGYILQPGDAGYSSDTTHGLIVAGDQATDIGWQDADVVAYVATGATATTIGSGKANTAAIVTANATQGSGPNTAKYCSDLVLLGQSDWYLPNKDELNKLHESRATIGNFASGNYWSSSETNFGNQEAWKQTFNSGGAQLLSNKRSPSRARGVSDF